MTLSELNKQYSDYKRLKRTPNEPYDTSGHQAEIVSYLNMYLTSPGLEYLDKLVTTMGCCTKREIIEVLDDFDLRSAIVYADTSEELKSILILYKKTHMTL